jgi:hypothetical protein
LNLRSHFAGGNHDSFLTFANIIEASARTTDLSMRYNFNTFFFNLTTTIYTNHDIIKEELKNASSFKIELPVPAGASIMYV